MQILFYYALIAFVAVVGSSLLLAFGPFFAIFATIPSVDVNNPGLLPQNGDTHMQKPVSISPRD